MKYFLYTRKSSEEQEKQALSLDTQLEKAKEIFPHLDLIILPPESASAYTPNNRPIFDDMIKRIDEGEAHGIVAWHPDRLSRNEIDAAAITYRVGKSKILDLKFGSYTFDNSPEGMMMLQIVMSQSQYSSSKLSKDVKRGNEKKIKMGWKPGWAPTGYLNTPERDKGTKIIVKDPDRFHLVRKMWDLLLTGHHSVPEILRIANEDWGFTSRKTRKMGGGPLSRSALYGMFTNIFYAGEILHNKVQTTGNHDAMITLAEYDRAQIILGRKGKPRPKKYQFTYRGPIICGECGSMITAEMKHKYIKSTGETREYTYYHCTHKKPCNQKGSVTEETIEKEMDLALSKITILPEFRDWALEVLRENNTKEISDRTRIHSNQLKASLSIQKQLDNLTSMRLKDLLNDEEYIEQKEKIIYEKRRLKELLDDTESRADKWLELTEKSFNFATNARECFKNGDSKVRRDIFTTLGKRFILKDKKLIIEPCEWFMPIQNNYSAIESAFNKVRTDKFCFSKERKADLTTIKLQWYSVVMQVRTRLYLMEQVSKTT